MGGKPSRSTSAGPPSLDQPSSGSIDDALSLVSITPISPFSSFWQVRLSELSFSSLNEDAEAIADTLDQAAKAMEKNTPFSDNMRTMVQVMCMALEQYPAVLAHQAMINDAEMTAINFSKNGNSNTNSPPSTPIDMAPPQPESIAAFFTRMYASPSNASTSAWTSLELKYASHTPPPDWLLNLTFLTRVFLQHMIVQLEYSERKSKLLSLRPIATVVMKEVESKHGWSAVKELTRRTHPQNSEPNNSIPPPPIHQDLAYRLVHTLLSSLIDIPLTPTTYELHLELSSLFLVLMSVQVYLPMTVHYAGDNLFMSHALLGPISKRAPELLAKLIQNTIRVESSVAASNGPSSSKASTITSPSSSSHHSVSLSVSAAHSLESHSGHAPPITPHAPSTSSSATNQHQQQHHTANGPSLSSRIMQLAGPPDANGNKPHFLKRLGSRLVSILLFPVQLYQYFFAGGGPSNSHLNLAADPLALRSNLIVLLLAHQSLDTFRTPKGEMAEDLDGRLRTVEYVHKNEPTFDLHQWQDERVLHSQQGGNEAPFVPTLLPAHAPSSIRETAPPVQLSVRVSSDSSLSTATDPASSTFDCPEDVNPYQHALSLLVDEGSEDESVSSTSSSTASSTTHTPSTTTRSLHSSGTRRKPMISFSALYNVLIASTSCESSTLLLYSLLHANNSFKEFILVKSDIDLLIVPWLGTLYEEYRSAFQRKSQSKSRSNSSQALSTSFHQNRVYMFLILLLILSNDRSFVENIHRRLILKRVPFSLESHLTNISLGSTMMLVLMKVIQTNLYEPRDHYVHTNCLAILSNISHSSDSLIMKSLNDPMAQCSINTSGGIKLHPSVCLKLIALLSVLSKKYAKLVEKEHRERIAAKAKAEQLKVQQSHPPHGKTREECKADLVKAIHEKVDHFISTTTHVVHTAKNILDPHKINLSPPNTLNITPIQAPFPQIPTNIQVGANGSAVNDAPPASNTPPPGLNVSSSSPVTSPTAAVNATGQSGVTVTVNGEPITASNTASTSPIEPPSPSASPSEGGQLDDSVIQATRSTVDELATFSSFIRLLLEILQSFLGPTHLSSNIYLLYSLMQSASLLEPFKHHSGFWESAGELQKLCQHFQQRIELAQTGVQATAATMAATSNLEMSGTSHPLAALSIESLMLLLKNEVKVYRNHMAHLCVKTSFSYEQQPHAEEFFIPYIWNVVHSKGDIIPFNEQLVVIFNIGGSDDDGLGVSGDESDIEHPEAARAELEQIHVEHSLQQQIGGAKTAEVAAAMTATSTAPSSTVTTPRAATATATANSNADTKRDIN